MSLLELEHLSVSFPAQTGTVRAVRSVSLRLDAGSALALVGETASGKSTVALALVGLLARGAHIDAGEIRLEGRVLAFGDRCAWRQVRGNKIGIVFQDARGALNPVLTVGSQLIAALRAHQQIPMAAARAAAAHLLADAGIPEPGFFMHRYPAELSGGMCQRVAIAIAACNQPQLLIADEPTSALDPSTQAQILELLRGMRERRCMALLLISHDLALVSQTVEEVAVMYHGRVVEYGRTQDIFRQPAHPYTDALLKCHADLKHRWGQRPLSAIPGSPPAADKETPGCAFASRCSRADSACIQDQPPAAEFGSGHWAACFKPIREPRGT